MGCICGNVYVRECVNVYSQGALNPCNYGYQVVYGPMGTYLMTMKKEDERERGMDGDIEKVGRCDRFCTIPLGQVA